MDLVEWGLPLIEWFQSASWLVPPARALSFIGSVPFMLVWIPVILWSVDRPVGRRLLVALLAWGIVNTLAKTAFAVPRPYWVEDSVLARTGEASFSLPSGHAAFAMAVFGALALAVRRRGIRVLSGAMIVGIGLSRVVLGVHWPADVVAGWLAGALVLTVVIWVDDGPDPHHPRRARSWARVPGFVRAGLIVSWLLLPLVAVRDVAEDAPALDPTWIRLAERGGVELDPWSVAGASVLTGLLAGVALGTVWLRGRELPPLAGLPAGSRVLRSLVGLTVLGGFTWLAGTPNVAGETAAWWLLAVGMVGGWWLIDGSTRAFAVLGLDRPSQPTSIRHR